jgi:ribosomal-protein-alanine N-acetyltransferase
MPELLLPEPPLSDSVVMLRPFTLDDVDWVTEGCQDPGVARFTGVPYPYTSDHAREWIGGQADERARGDGMHLAVTAATDGSPLGAVGMASVDWDHERAELGYWTVPAARGRGVAPRALRLLAAHLFEAAGLRRIEVIPFAANPSSQRVAETAGCRREGVLRSYYVRQGERHDCVLYSLLPEDL